MSLTLLLVNNQVLHISDWVKFLPVFVSSERDNSIQSFVGGKKMDPKVASGNTLSRTARGVSWLPMYWVVDVGFGSKEERGFLVGFFNFSVDAVGVGCSWFAVAMGGLKRGGGRF